MFFSNAYEANKKLTAWPVSQWSDPTVGDNPEMVGSADPSGNCHIMIS
jgi:hypothetical protein